MRSWEIKNEESTKLKRDSEFEKENVERRRSIFSFRCSALEPEFCSSSFYTPLGVITFHAYWYFDDILAIFVDLVQSMS